MKCKNFLCYNFCKGLSPNCSLCGKAFFRMKECEQRKAFNWLVNKTPYVSVEMLKEQKERRTL